GGAVGVFKHLQDERLGRRDNRQAVGPAALVEELADRPHLAGGVRNGYGEAAHAVGEHAVHQFTSAGSGARRPSPPSPLSRDWEGRVPSGCGGAGRRADHASAAPSPARSRRYRRASSSRGRVSAARTSSSTRSAMPPTVSGGSWPIGWGMTISGSAPSP